MSAFALTPVLHVTVGKDDPFPPPESWFIGDATPAITLHVGRFGRRNVEVYTFRRDGSFDHETVKRSDCGCRVA